MEPHHDRPAQARAHERVEAVREAHGFVSDQPDISFTLLKTFPSLTTRRSISAWACPTVCLRIYAPSSDQPDPNVHTSTHSPSCPAQKHFGVDMPHGVLAHMDPILIKKIDWETTHGLDDWDSVLEDTGSEFAREQWGMESLSHHFLPLIRYRRAKARALYGKWAAESASAVRH